MPPPFVAITRFAASPVMRTSPTTADSGGGPIGTHHRVRAVARRDAVRGEETVEQAPERPAEGSSATPSPTFASSAFGIIQA